MLDCLYLEYNRWKWKQKQLLIKTITTKKERLSRSRKRKKVGNKKSATTYSKKIKYLRFDGENQLVGKFDENLFPKDLTIKRVISWNSDKAPPILQRINYISLFINQISNCKDFFSCFQHWQKFKGYWWTILMHVKRYLNDIKWYVSNEKESEKKYTSAKIKKRNTGSSDIYRYEWKLLPELNLKWTFTLFREGYKINRIKTINEQYLGIDKTNNRNNYINQNEDEKCVMAEWCWATIGIKVSVIKKFQNSDKAIPEIDLQVHQRLLRTLLEISILFAVMWINKCIINNSSSRVGRRKRGKKSMKSERTIKETVKQMPIIEMIILEIVKMVTIL